ncbi:MAG: hypothetical protein ACFE8F_05305 [Promethearchaeota archaeon]
MISCTASFSPTSVSAQETRIYQLRVITTYQNLTSSYFGTEIVSLNSTGDLSFEGILSWNITFDEGQTWLSDSVQVTYDWNRTYQYAGLMRYTAWWIHPSVQLGSQIQIDGDAPATNNHLRIQPFTVTDLISLDLDRTYYLCWQLTYNTNHQHETYYYDYYTGVLLKASTIVENIDQPVHEIYLTMESATPAPPSINPFHHLWITYNSFLLALIGASLVSLIVYYLLQRLRTQRFQTPFSVPFENARLKNELKIPARHPYSGD